MALDAWDCVWGAKLSPGHAVPGAKLIVAQEGRAGGLEDRELAAAAAALPGCGAGSDGAGWTGPGRVYVHDLSVSRVRWGGLDMVWLDVVGGGVSPRCSARWARRRGEVRAGRLAGTGRASCCQSAGRG